MSATFLGYIGYRKWKRLQIHREKMRVMLQKKFIEAAYTTNFPLMKKCLKEGVDPNCLSDEYGMGALHIAAQRGDIVLAKILLQSGAINVDLLSDHDRTPLLITCIFNRKQFAYYLLKLGADPNISDTGGRTPLHMCIRFASISILLMLIKANANINAMDTFEQTPLSLALTDFRNIRAARILLIQGFDFNVERKRRLHVYFETILQCKHINDVKYVTILLDFGVDVNTVDPISRRTCLHFVGITGCLPLAVELVGRGATMVKDCTGRTPALVAKDYGHQVLYNYYVKGVQPVNFLLLLKYVKKWRAKIVKPVLAKLEDADMAKEQDEEEEVNTWDDIDE